MLCCAEKHVLPRYHRIIGERYCPLNSFFPCPVSVARYALPGGALNETALVEALRPPVPRAVFDAAVAEVCEKRRARAAGGGGGGGGRVAPGAQEEVGGGCSAGLGAQTQLM